MVGAGVIGLTTAVVLAERGYPVELVSAGRGRATASHAAAALIGPAVPLFGEQMLAWAETGIREFSKLARDGGRGVRLQDGRLVTATTDETPEWAYRIPGYGPCSPEERAGFPVAFWAELPIVDMLPYLDYLEQRLRLAGGTVTERTVTDLRDGWPPETVVVNSAGAAAGKFAADDQLTPVYGLSVIVPNPGLDTFFYEAAASEWVSWFCHGDRLSLGGDALLQPPADPEAAAAEIIARCAAVEPRLQGLEPLEIRVGARPMRETARLEWDAASPAPLLHHYGHGSVGVTTSWGAAFDAADLIEEELPGR
ncbi:D-amino acid dehydrogenase small subunit [Arthrobacter saudimassiliensis]|uniref:D-amino-acid oxidase n=1 Tax=Arthrobacter saudimassiliensis TaxID=1461584 RepID=A0A078MNB7_9MICC|nr:D-amino acid dehydrogenase small subunit [Arthrobacter saudimassiliensis]